MVVESVSWAFREHMVHDPGTVRDYLTLWDDLSDTRAGGKVGVGMGKEPENPGRPKHHA